MKEKIRKKRIKTKKTYHNNQYQYNQKFNLKNTRNLKKNLRLKNINKKLVKYKKKILFIIAMTNNKVQSKKIQ